MKRKIAFLIYIICIPFLLVSCDWDGPLRREMLEYYVQDENYTSLTGIVKEVDYFKVKDEMYLTIELLNLELLEEDQTFTFFMKKDGKVDFVIVNWSKFDFEIKEGRIFFTSADFHFYNGHTLPIIALSNEEEELISFAEGKQNYIDWINETFGEDSGC